ncbi:MAG: phage minor tail protein L [Actinobacteria bacterium]|jgi:lambda family phage minor tail protein L|nr:phage minor tail protein L [Actinomycetota bacterium]
MIPNLLSLNPDSFIELYEIYKYRVEDINKDEAAQNPNVPSTMIETIRIGSIAMDENTPWVVFEGKTYYAVGCQGEGFDLIGRGTIPTPTLTVSNVGGILTKWLKDSRDPAYRLEGTHVKRHVTQKRFLDGQVDANAGVKELPIQIYVIEQLVEENYTNAKFRLGSAFDVEGITLPARVMVRSCTWVYRSPECSYANPAKFTINNEPTQNASEDFCAKTIAACETRFGAGSILPFGGFPGLNTY